MMSSLFRMFLRTIHAESFYHPDFSQRLLLKHLVYQKILRINAHVPWPVHPTSIVNSVQNINRGTRFPGLSPGCYIQGINGIQFGANVWVGPGVGIISANHDIYDFSQHLRVRPIVIGDHCWIGMNSVVLPGVTLGTHVIVGAGSVVTDSFEENCVVAGNPARIIKKIDSYTGSREYPGFN